MENDVFEEYPSWRMPDLAVTGMAVDPAAAAPGSTVTVRVRIGNQGTATAAPARVAVTVNTAQIAAWDIEAMPPGQDAERNIRWRVRVTGRVLVEARLQIVAKGFDADTRSHVASAVLRVDDGSNVPELEYDLTIDSTAARPRRSITLVLRNPSLTTVRDVPVHMYADGLPLHALAGRRTLVTAGPGEEQSVRFALPELDPGRHHFVVHLVPPQELPLHWLQCVKCWEVVVPDRTVLFDGVQKDRWVWLVVRRVGGTAVVFAATDVGIVRYQGNDPRELVSAPSDWVQSRSGVATDVVVHPTNASLVYGSVSGEGIVRTTSGLTALQADWSTLSGPVDLTGTTGSSFTLDVFWGSPRTVLAGLTSPRPGSVFGLYRTHDEGGSWDRVEYAAGTLEGPYNPFVRVHPADRDLVYFGGIKLYKKRWGTTGQTIVTGVHDDMHGFEFDPAAPGEYLVTADGGVFRGTIAADTLPDTCTPRNLDLRVTQFFDIDAASANAALMVGGTQDNGTVLFEGTPDWRLIMGGDGLFSCIAPSNNDVFYAQHQSLDSTARSVDGGKTWVPANHGLPKGFTMMDSFIVVHPRSADEVLSQGDQVYVTQNGGAVAYVGTDKGVYAWTDGKPTYDSWRDYSLGLPLVEINDLLIDPTSRDLRAGTWGRGVWAVVTGP